MTAPPPRSPRTLVLASSSPYRRDLLARLGLAFVVDSPDIDETRLKDEAPAAYVQRLALAKARAVAARHPGAVAIGSDQAAVCGADVLGKPGSAQGAREQLARLSGNPVDFLTALAVVGSADAQEQVELDCTRVMFRALTTAEIRAYVARELPVDCAGSFKSEGLGIALFENIASDDPTALIGLPLIALCRMLRIAGIDPLWDAADRV